MKKGSPETVNFAAAAGLITASRIVVILPKSISAVLAIEVGVTTAAEAADAAERPMAATITLKLLFILVCFFDPAISSLS